MDRGEINLTGTHAARRQFDPARSFSREGWEEGLEPVRRQNTSSLARLEHRSANNIFKFMIQLCHIIILAMKQLLWTVDFALFHH